MRCWKVGSMEIGYLLYSAETRGKARELGTEMLGMGDGFYEALYLDVLRVPHLDDLVVVQGSGDRQLILLAGMWDECVGCHRSVILEPTEDQREEFSPAHFEFYSDDTTGPYCEVCIQDAPQAEMATREQLMRRVRDRYGSAVTE